MFFEQKRLSEMIGEKIGFLFGFVVFTTLLFGLLSYLHKLPSSWTYFHLSGITAAITCLGLMVKRYLE